MTNIEKIINNKMNDLHLVQIESPSFFIEKRKRFYAASVFDSDHKKVFFKLLIVNDEEAIKSIKKEIKMRNLMLNFQNKITFPHLINYNDQDMPYWFISQYLEGQTLGLLYDLTDTRDETISLLVNTLSSLHEISKTTLASILKDDFFIPEDGFINLLDILKSYENQLNNKIKQKVDFSIITQFIKDREKYFQNHKVILTHGDYTLNNMVLSHGKMVLTDWESANLGNIASDITHLWIQLWRYPSFRQKLLRNYIKTLPDEEIDEFKKLFEARVIFGAMAETIWNIKICPTKYQKSLVEICIKTINVALEGFDELLKL
jgi:thiamine kinase-like enzyme